VHVLVFTLLSFPASPFVIPPFASSIGPSVFVSRYCPDEDPSLQILTVTRHIAEQRAEVLEWSISLISLVPESPTPLQVEATCLEMPDKGKQDVHPLPLPAFPLPPPSVQGAPRALYSPTPRPSSLPASFAASATGGPAVLPTSVVARNLGLPDCTARSRTAPRSWCRLWFWLAWVLSAFLQDGSPDVRKSVRWYKKIVYLSSE